jgi:hypothetical protein
MDTLESILELSDAEFGSSLRQEETLRLRITQESSVESLKAFIKRSDIYDGSSSRREFTLRRILDIAPADLSALVALAWELWLVGEDEESQEKLLTAKEISPGHRWVLWLEAALSRDTSAHILILEKLLQQDPNDHLAHQNLEALRLGALDQVLQFSPDECMDDW